MNKLKPLAAALVAVSLPTTAGAYTQAARHDYLASMAVSYCMWKYGPWTQDYSAEWFVDYMNNRGHSSQLIRYYQKEDNARDIVAVIDNQGGCTSIVSDIRRGRSSRQPASVLSDTPFRF